MALITGLAAAKSLERLATWCMGLLLDVNLFHSFHQ